MEKNFNARLGEIINIALTEKNHTKANLGKQIKSSLLRANVGDSKERIANILKVKKAAIEAEGDMHIGINETSLFENDIQQLKYLEEIMTDFEKNYME